MRRTTLILTFSLLVASCTSRIDSRGNLPDLHLLNDIRVGEYSKNDVFDTIGSPSSIAYFDEEVWFYISKRTETTAFLAPKIVDRKTVIIRFDDKGIVKTLETRGIAESRNVAIIERETPTTGHKLGFFEQIIGNLGRFENR